MSRGVTPSVFKALTREAKEAPSLRVKSCFPVSSLTVTFDCGTTWVVPPAKGFGWLTAGLS